MSHWEYVLVTLTSQTPDPWTSVCVCMCVCKNCLRSTKIHVLGPCPEKFLLNCTRIQPRNLHLLSTHGKSDPILGPCPEKF